MLFSQKRDAHFGIHFIYRESISQAGMLAFQFGAAREREKLKKRVSHRSFHL
jgi:hypothetical protein